MTRIPESLSGQRQRGHGPDREVTIESVLSRPVLIAGPTASGKSALAMALARRIDGVVINADSQQVYREWRVLTARPSAEDEAAIPHRLYGHVSVAEQYSVGRWLEEVRGVLAEALAAGSRPVIVGGSGLYFSALTRGLAPIPNVPQEVRMAGETALARLGLARLAADLAARDPATAAGIDLANPRRVLRAREVLEATGIGLAEWQARTGPPLVPLDRAAAVALVPPREWLHVRTAARFDAMMAAGALDEVRAAIARRMPREKPGMKAVGAAELAAHLAGELTLAEAVARAKTETRHYARRQLTWIRNRMAEWRVVDPSEPDALSALIGSIG